MKTSLHFRTHDETRFHWHPLLCGPFSITASVVLTVVVVLMLALLAT